MSDTLICILQCLLTATCWICHRYPSLQASSPVALWQWSRKRKEIATTSLEFEFHFQFPYGSPTTELTVRYPPNSTKRKQLQVYTNIKSQCQGIVITSLLMSSLLISISHRLFRSRYSNSRDIVGSCSFLYPPHRQSAPESLLAGYQYL